MFIERCHVYCVFVHSFEFVQQVQGHSFDSGTLNSLFVLFIFGQHKLLKLVIN